MIMSAAMGFFPKGLKNDFETAVVNEPSVLEPLKFYCIRYLCTQDNIKHSRLSAVVNRQIGKHSRMHIDIVALDSTR